MPLQHLPYTQYRPLHLSPPTTRNISDAMPRGSLPLVDTIPTLFCPRLLRGPIRDTHLLRPLGQWIQSICHLLSLPRLLDNTRPPQPDQERLPDPGNTPPQGHHGILCYSGTPTPNLPPPIGGCIGSQFRTTALSPHGHVAPSP